MAEIAEYKKIESIISLPQAQEVAAAINDNLPVLIVRAKWTEYHVPSIIHTVQNDFIRVRFLHANFFSSTSNIKRTVKPIFRNFLHRKKYLHYPNLSTSVSFIRPYRNLCQKVEKREKYLSQLLLQN